MLLTYKKFSQYCLLNVHIVQCLQYIIKIIVPLFLYQSYFALVFQNVKVLFPTYFKSHSVPYSQISHIERHPKINLPSKCLTKLDRQLPSIQSNNKIFLTKCCRDKKMCSQCCLLKVFLQLHYKTTYHSITRHVCFLSISLFTQQTTCCFHCRLVGGSVVLQG